MNLRRPPKRDAELSTKPAIEKKLLDVYKDVEKGFQDQRDRSDRIKDNWDLFNCLLGPRQVYNGDSRIFAPLIHDAVNARKTRFINQMFPQGGRYVEVTTGEADLPSAIMSLLEGYVRKAKLRTKVMPALLINGDVEGQYSLYVSWLETSRNVTRRESVADVKLGRGENAVEVPEFGEHDEYVGEEIRLGRPDVEVLHDADLLILPTTTDDVDEAIEVGGSVTVMRRWTKSLIKKKITDGDIRKDVGELLLKEMNKQSRGENVQRDPKKDMADAAGIKGGGSHALVYETWTRIKVEGEMRLCRIYFGGDKQILGCKLCPYWCDRVPVITAPVEKIAGSIKGRAPVAAVSELQILANDVINEGADTGHFSAMPIVMTDPEKNPRAETMVLGLAAVWQVDPKSTQFAQFPDMWRSMIERVSGIKDQIFQSLGVNPSMIPQSSGGAGKKRNQAEVAMEQQIDLATTADMVTVLEESILTPLIQRFAEYDHQFRDEAITTRVYGEIGVNASMERVEPIQLNEKWEFRWWGVEAARNAAQQQQQIAGLNVMKGIPPQMYPNYDFDIAPVLVQMSENLFGPRLGPLVFKRKKLVSVDPMQENEMLEHGFRVQVHPADDDMVHLQAHMALMTQDTHDFHGTIREHIAAHQQQMMAKAQGQQQAQQGGAPGGPGGAGPGVAGTPKPGAQPAPPRQGKQPAGAIHPDQMARAGAPGMPRKM